MNGRSDFWRISKARIYVLDIRYLLRSGTRSWQFRARAATWLQRRRQCGFMCDFLVPACARRCVLRLRFTISAALGQHSIMAVRRSLIFLQPLLQPHHTNDIRITVSELGTIILLSV